MSLLKLSSVAITRCCCTSFQIRLDGLAVVTKCICST